MAIADKLTQLNNVKLAIKQALINKGVSMNGVAFTNYASKIDLISTSVTPLIPKMTSNTSPKGTVSASRYSSGKEPYKAFSRENNIWQIDYVSSANTSDYLMYTFANTVKSVKAWSLACYKGVGGTADGKILLVLSDNSEVQIGTFTEKAEGDMTWHYGNCDYKNVKAVKIMPIGFTSYSQFTINDFQVYGEE